MLIAPLVLIALDFWSGIRKARKMGDIISPAWLSVWMAFLFLVGSLFVQPEGKLAKAVNGKAVFIAETVCYIALVGALLINI